MPKWKAQTPIEVFEDNDVSVDARRAPSVSGKHRYHVGDSSRRARIDKAEVSRTTPP